MVWLPVRCPVLILRHGYQLDKADACRISKNFSPSAVIISVGYVLFTDSIFCFNAS